MADRRAVPETTDVAASLCECRRIDRLERIVAALADSEMWLKPEIRELVTEIRAEQSAPSAIQCAAYIGGEHGRCPNMGLRENDEMVDADGTGRKVWLSWCDFHHLLERGSACLT